MSDTVAVYSDNEPMTPDEAFDEAMAFTPDEFAALPVKARDVALFVLLRGMVGEVRAGLDRINSFADKVEELSTPEGRERMIKEFMGSFGGGLFGGMM